MQFCFDFLLPNFIVSKFMHITWSCSPFLCMCWYVTIGSLKVLNFYFYSMSQTDVSPFEDSSSMSARNTLPDICSNLTGVSQPHRRSQKKNRIRLIQPVLSHCYAKATFSM